MFSLALFASLLCFNIGMSQEKMEKETAMKMEKSLYERLGG